MTTQSKNARKLAKARDITKMHKNGDKGPAKTTPLHNKRWGYRTNPEVQKRVAEQLKATQTGKTVLDKLNQAKTVGKAHVG